MTSILLNRRNLLAAGGAVLATGVSGLLLPARAEGLAPTASMSGGANNYRKGAAVVERIGKGGFWMSGTVRRTGGNWISPARSSVSSKPRHTISRNAPLACFHCQASHSCRDSFQRLSSG